MRLVYSRIPNTCLSQENFDLSEEWGFLCCRQNEYACLGYEGEKEWKDGLGYTFPVPEKTKLSAALHNLANSFPW